MPKLNIRQTALLETLLHQAEEQIANKTLDVLADQEMRICLLELGI